MFVKLSRINEKDTNGESSKNKFINFFVVLSDINECEDNDLNHCGNKLDCENTDGGYICNKRKSKSKKVIIGMSLYLLNYQNKYKTKNTNHIVT